jgi:ABC-type transport system involved in multi-copper enzyme maturation permease subunit
MIVFGAVASENVSIGGGIGNVYKNAPFVIEQYYVLLSLLCLMMTTAFMNASAIRDFTSGMHQFVFSSPIQKRDYYFGKFIGAAIVSVIPFLGISIGALLGPILAPIFGWCPAERFGPIVWNGHFQGIIAFAIPNVIISGVLLFALAIIYRSTIVSFIGSMVILVFYGISRIFTSDIKKEWIANILDPFGGNALGIMSKYKTIDDKNLSAVSLGGELLLNRMLWLGISLIILIAVYHRFSFAIKNEKVKKKNKKEIIRKTEPDFVSNQIFEAKNAGKFSWNSFWSLIKFETKTVIKNPVFVILIIMGLTNLILSLWTFSGQYGAIQYPVTFDIVETIKGEFLFFIYGFITFYAGVLVWKERDAKINEIQDATPIKSTMLFVSKLIALIFAVFIVLLSSILVGIISQVLHGYYRFEIGVYIKSLLIIQLLSFIYLTVLALLFHYLINNKYIAYFAFIVFLILNFFIWGALEINSNMLSFNATPSITYSDMNGFGPFVPGTIWFNIYWGLFAVILCYVINAFFIRGKETDFKTRWNNAKTQFKASKIGLLFAIIAFVVCGGFVYYNTKVLNTYDSPETAENNQVNYEKQFKKYQNLAQPKYTDFTYNIDIFPAERSLKVKIESWVKNKTTQPITEIHFTMPSLSDSINVIIPKAKLKLNDKVLKYRIYSLSKPLMPNDSIKINYELENITKGFENEVSFKSLTQNGTFFNNGDITPTIGYDANIEIADKNKRIEFKLPKRLRMPKLEPNNLIARSNNYFHNDADWVHATTNISTSFDQIAVAPGSLIKSWKAAKRNYFTYKLDHKSLAFFSFISAKYEVARKKWNGIDLEVYYHKDHAVNVPNMLKSMEKSLDYYTKNYGPYYHKQCRIIEFPRYESFAQAFPGTMPYSEEIGFITDLRDVNKDAIDVPFSVVAHEMAHQYWAQQVIGANMQGSEMFSEGFAEYSSLMVMEKEYGKDKMKQFLAYEMNNYLSGRGREYEGEMPLAKCEHQNYIHYAKASVVMYYFKEMIGEDKVNLALNNLIKKFAYKEPPYATTVDVLAEFRAVTPADKQYLIADLFEKITLFSNRTKEVSYKKVGSEYEVTIKTISEKFYANSQGKETTTPLNDFIDIGVFAKSNKSDVLGKVLVYKRLKITKKDNTFIFKTKEKPYEAGIDPNNYLIDKIPDDNLKTFE